MPTPASLSEDEGENEEYGENPDPEGDNEEVNAAGGEEFAPVEDDDESGMWDGIFNSHYDSKPYGGCYFYYTK